MLKFTAYTTSESAEVPSIEINRYRADGNETSPKPKLLAACGSQKPLSGPSRSGPPALNRVTPQSLKKSSACALGTRSFARMASSMARSFRCEKRMTLPHLTCGRAHFNVNATNEVPDVV